MTRSSGIIWGRLRKRKIKHAKRAWRLAPSGTASEWTRRGSWPRPWAAPRWPAASWPTRSCCRSSSACGRLWNRPDGVPVSMESVRLLNWTPCLCRSPTRSTSCLTDRPSRSSFQTTKVSPSRSISSVLAKPGRSARVPLTLSSKTFLHPALLKASRCSSRF
ncbi:Uncharacterised protein [Klebsiella variicola]|nr:Uncharacterised protein [Klebsiella variicola]